MSFPPLLHSIEKKCNELLPGIYVAQPYGKLCYAWFTDVCTLIDRTTKKQWTVPVTFDTCLKDTIVSGVYIDNCFVMDNLYHYKGVALQCSYEEKVKMMKKMVAMEIRGFFLPEFSTKATYKHSLKIIQEGITYHYTPKTFQVKSTPKSDIYEVYKDGVLQTIACIDTLACSEAMNRLFHPTDTFVEKTLTMECTWNETFKKWTPKI
jgi:hypothetical protein